MARSDRRERRSDTLDAIEGLSAIETLPDLVAYLHKTFATFGVDHFVVAGLPNPHERFEKVLVLKHWSADWYDHYTKQHFVKDDPVVRMCRTTTMPFEWTDAPFDPEREPRARELMNVAGDFGLTHGFSVPVHGLTGCEACFSVSSAKPVFDGGSKAAIHLIALYAFERVRRLTMGASTFNPLTARERDVLAWIAAGKSHRDIAEILSITERTVTAHAVNATNKLGAANRTHAVVRALQAKFISI